MSTKKKVARPKKVAKKATKKKTQTRAENADFQDTKIFKYVSPVGVKDPLKLLEFIRWTAVPTKYKDIKTQGELAKEIGIDETTLSRWKWLEFFWDEVASIRDQEFRRFSTKVAYQGIVEPAFNGNHMAAKLFFQKFEGFSEKVTLDKPIPATDDSENEELKTALRNMGFKVVEPVLVVKENAGSAKQDEDFE